LLAGEAVGPTIKNMITWPFPKILGGKNDRELSRLRPIVSRINTLEAALQGEPVEKLQALTSQWKIHLARYHPLEVPTKSQLDGMDELGLRETAGDLEARLSALRKEFSSLPSEVKATVASIEKAKADFQRIESGFEDARAKYLQTILPEAYAVVKNAARRLCGQEVMVNEQPMTWQMVHFDVQLIGGIALHRGLISEMQTGEGKTLVATLPVYLNALTGLGVHVVTVNDYLAKRDSEWMGALFQFLGLSVGCLQSQMPPEQRRSLYACDITYGTNSEFGFDYLRDNGIAASHHEQVQRGHYLAIIDEIDSILIDDARTPLIITGASESSVHPFDLNKPRVQKLVKLQTALCNELAAEAKRLFEAGEKNEAGLRLFKLKLGQPRHRQFLRFMENSQLRRLVEQTELRFQQKSFRKDFYKLKEDLYFVIDEKGRDADLMEKGRQFLAPDDPDSFTLPDIVPAYEAIEANPKLSRAEKGETKQSLQEQRNLRAGEIHGISQLLKAYCLHEKDVHYVVREGKVTIIDESTGREMAGRRWSDGLHQAVEAKEGVPIEDENKTFATITIQNYFRLYEKLAGMTGTAETEAAEFHDIYELDVLPIPTNAPNLRIDSNDQVFKTRREKFQAVISTIERAHAIGQPVLVGTASVESSETLSRMLQRAKIPHGVLNAKYHEKEAAIVSLAGQRGAVTVSTNMAGRGTDIKLGEGVAEVGGLFIIGTERNSSRRVDRQLRGRCSRQGDPGRSQFFLSLEDDLMRNHASPQHMASLVERSTAAASTGRNTKIPPLGKLVETAQRVVELRDYQSRKSVLDFDDVMNLQREIVYAHRNDVLTTEDTRALAKETITEGVAHSAREYLSDPESFDSSLSSLSQSLQAIYGVILTEDEIREIPMESLPEVIADLVRDSYEENTRLVPNEIVEREERHAFLAAIDRLWQEHLADMEELREGVYLRAQGQKDPLVEYKNEGYTLFLVLMEAIKQQVTAHLFSLSVGLQASIDTVKNSAIEKASARLG
jgi:preprotein translocase subunit SecA